MNGDVAIMMPISHTTPLCDDNFLLFLSPSRDDELSDAANFLLYGFKVKYFQVCFAFMMVISLRGMVRNFPVTKNKILSMVEGSLNGIDF